MKNILSKIKKLTLLEILDVIKRKVKTNLQPIRRRDLEIELRGTFLLSHKDILLNSCESLKFGC